MIEILFTVTVCIYDEAKVEDIRSMIYNRIDFELLELNENIAFLIKSEGIHDTKTS